MSEINIEDYIEITHDLDNTDVVDHESDYIENKNGQIDDVKGGNQIYKVDDENQIDDSGDKNQIYQVNNENQIYKVNNENQIYQVNDVQNGGGKSSSGLSSNYNSATKKDPAAMETAIPMLPDKYRTKNPSAFDHLFSCSSLDSFISSIQQILPYGGYSQSKFFLCLWKGVTFLTKMVFYRKTVPELYIESPPSIDFLASPDAEIAILEILKHEINYANISPCVLEIIYHKKCNSKEYSHVNKKTCETLIRAEKPKTNLYEIVRGYFCWHYFMMSVDFDYKYFSFMVLEECGPSLRKYINSMNPGDNVALEVFKSLMFQIVYTMHRILKIYPGFRHYDFHSDNILLKFDPKYNPAAGTKYMVFNDSETKYCVPYFGVIAKIIDFGFSSIPERNIKSNIELDKYTMFTRKGSDMLFLLHDLYTATKAQELSDVMDILVNIDPGDCFMSPVFYFEGLPDAPTGIASNTNPHTHNPIDMLQRWPFKEYICKNMEIVPSKEHIWHEYN